MDPVTAALIHARANPGLSLGIDEPFDPAVFKLEGIEFNNLALVRQPLSADVLRELGRANTRALLINVVPNLDVAALGETLRDNPYIKAVRLWRTDLTDAGFALIAQNLPPNIEYFSFVFNDGLHDVSPLVGALQRYPHLRDIASGVPIPPEVSRQMRENVYRRRSLQRFGLYNYPYRHPWTDAYNAARTGALPQVFAAMGGVGTTTALGRFLGRDGDNAIMYRVLMLLLPRDTT